MPPFCINIHAITLVYIDIQTICNEKSTGSSEKSNFPGNTLFWTGLMYYVVVFSMYDTLDIFSIFTLKRRPLFLTDGVYIALAAAVPIGHRFKIHLFWTTKINDGPFISGSDFFSC